MRVVLRIQRASNMGLRDLDNIAWVPPITKLHQVIKKADKEKWIGLERVDGVIASTVGDLRSPLPC